MLNFIEKNNPYRVCFNAQMVGIKIDSAYYVKLLIYAIALTLDTNRKHQR